MRIALEPATPERPAEAACIVCSGDATYAIVIERRLPPMLSYDKRLNVGDEIRSLYWLCHTHAFELGASVLVLAGNESMAHLAHLRDAVATAIIEAQERPL